MCGSTQKIVEVRVNKSTRDQRITVGLNNFNGANQKVW